MNAEEKLEMLKSTIKQLYSKEGRSKSYISKLLSVNRQKLSKKIAEWNLPEAEPRRHLTPSNQKFLNKHKNLIKSRLDNDTTITRIADELGVSRDYLQKTIIPADDILSQAKNDYITRLAEKSAKAKSDCMLKSSLEYNIVDLPDEIWKPIMGYDGYMISNYSRVKHFSKRYKSFHLITPAANAKSGYMYVSLYDKNKRRNINLARLVALNFVDGYDENHNTVNHKDGDKTNNAASNLEWLSQSQNNKHAYDVLHRKSPIKRYDFVKIIYKDKYEFKTVTALAKFMGKSETQVRRYMDNPSAHDIQLIR